MVTFRSAFVLAFALFAVAVPAAAAVTGGGVRVVDGDTLWLGQTEVRLSGIDAPEHAQTCGRADGDWDCGVWAADALRDMVAGREVTCEGQATDRYGRLLATCHVGGAEINRALVRAGAALAYRRYSALYVADERAAQRAGLGVWAGTVQVPEAFRHSDRVAAVSDPRDAGPQDSGPRDGACRIKGNISANGRIYHRPGQENYAATGIDTSRGERWFCTDAEARAAGWRAARR